MLHTKMHLYIALAAVAMVTLCHSQVNRCFPGERQEVPSSAFTKGVEDFGLSIFKQLALEKAGSIFLSPYSLWSVLSLAYFGSEGRTRAQLERALHLRSKSGTFTNWNALKFMLHGNPSGTSGARFRSTNRAYFSNTLILQRCLTNILFDLRRIDFTNNEEAKNIINHDVNITTEGKIENFIDFLSPDTEFALINAVFFKGLWETPFSPNDTRKQEFLIPPGVAAGPVSMMVQSFSFKYGVSADLEATILELPYENSSVSMFLLLPDQLETYTTMGLLTRESLETAISQMVKRPVEVGLPKFKITTRVENELKSSLYSLGITDLFEPGRANLTSFTKSAPLFADKVIHQATAEISEEGTVAAAASGLIGTRVGIKPVQFMCNRPFIFLIRDRVTGITLFAGEFNHPDDTESL